MYGSVSGKIQYMYISLQCSLSSPADASLVTRPQLPPRSQVSSGLHPLSQYGAHSKVEMLAVHRNTGIKWPCMHTQWSADRKANILIQPVYNTIQHILNILIRPV